MNGSWPSGKLADTHTYVCRTSDDLPPGLCGCVSKATARRANGYVDRPLLPCEQLRLVEKATRLSLANASTTGLDPDGTRGILGGRCRRTTSRSCDSR